MQPDRGAAPTGTAVNLLVQPVDGYRAEIVTATQTGGWPLTVERLDDLHWRFRAGAGNAEVHAVFVPEAAVSAVRLPFTDVPEDAPWRDSLVWLYGRGLMGGLQPDAFQPDLPYDRASLVMALYAAEGSLLDGQGIAAASLFPDVSPARWYSLGVTWAARTGVVPADGGPFRPDDAVTSSELTDMLDRYCLRKGITLSREDAPETQTNAAGPVLRSAAVTRLAQVFGEIEAAKQAAASGV